MKEHKFRFEDKNILTWISILIGFLSILILCFCGITIYPNGELEFNKIPFWIYFIFLLMILWTFIFLLYKMFELEKRISEIKELEDYIILHIENKTEKDIEHILKYSKRTRILLLNHILNDNNNNDLEA